MAETPKTDHALQLAMFMQRRDAMQFGVVKDGEVTPSWEDSGLAQHEYLADAETALAAVEILGYVHAPALAKAKADALREIADVLAKPQVLWHGDGGVTVWADYPAGDAVKLTAWVRARADEIEKEAT